MPTCGGGTPVRSLLYSLVYTLSTRRFSWIYIFVTVLGDVDIAWSSGSRLITVNKNLHTAIEVFLCCRRLIPLDLTLAYLYAWSHLQITPMLSDRRVPDRCVSDRSADLGHSVLSSFAATDSSCLVLRTWAIRDRSSWSWPNDPRSVFCALWHVRLQSPGSQRYLTWRRGTRVLCRRSRI